MTERQLKIWNRLSTRSRRAIRKRVGKWGMRYSYRPRGDLLTNLGLEFNLSVDQVYSELQSIRKWWLGQEQT